MRILVVEDDEQLAKSIKKGLEYEGYAVDYILDGEEARRRIGMYRMGYDLIILDLNLPGTDGFDICRNARKDRITTPIIVLTGRTSVEDKIRALDSGADDYVVKPFAFEELSSRIRALLRRPTQEVALELQIGALKLNTVTRSVTLNGKKVPLTLKEYMLLEYLMRHPNQVLDREKILEHVWDYNFDSFSNVIDVHMKNLRKKIDRDAGKKLLETIRGVGYRISG